MVDEAGHEQSARSVRNDLSGTVTGSVVQAGTIRQLIVRQSPRREELPVPRQLPPAVHDFEGRDHQLARLDALLFPGDGNRRAGMVISALAGTAGVGKTTLAVQWAHRVEHHFTDGTLFANLRGYGPSSPLDPNLVLPSFLHVFGIQEDRVPAELDAQVGLYRSLLADAEAASQVTLDLFTPDEADALVRRILGPERVDAEPRAVADLIEVCARLPLALRVAATRIATSPRTSIADVVEDITDEQDRLDMLSSSGDERSAVRTVFDWSYTQLAGEHAHLFHRLGLHPGAEFSTHAAAALAGIDAVTAYRQLEALADAHLIESRLVRQDRSES